MVGKKKLLLIAFLFILVSLKCMCQEISFKGLDIKLSKTLTEKKLSITMKCTNESTESIYIPKVFLNLIQDDKYIVGDWLLIYNGKNHKELKHRSVFKEIVLGDMDLVRKYSVILEPGESYAVEIKNVKKYFWTPFFLKTLYIKYDGPLGESNSLYL